MSVPVVSVSPDLTALMRTELRLFPLIWFSPTIQIGLRVEFWSAVLMSLVDGMTVPLNVVSPVRVGVFDMFWGEEITIMLVSVWMRRMVPARNW